MEVKHNLIILGAGGFGRTVADVARQLGCYATICHLDDKPAEGVVGPLASFTEHISEATEFFVAFGDNALRLEWLKRLENAGGQLAILVHPTAYVSPEATLQQGSIAMPMAIVNTAVHVGRGCIINCGCIIDHNCIIEEGCHICLGAIIKAENRILAKSKVETGELIANRTCPFKR